MKCPFCNFLNSNTRNDCLRCNADLTELKLEFGVNDTINTGTTEGGNDSQKVTPPKMPLPRVILKTSSQLQIASLQSKIAKLQGRQAPDDQSNVSPILENEMTAFEDNTAESSMTKEEVEALIHETKVENNSPFPPTEVDEEFQIRFLNTSYELETRMKHWRFIFNPKIESSYNELLDILPIHSDEFEIGQHTQLNEKKKKEIDQLYDLQLKEMSSNKNNKKDFQKSHTRSLDRNKLDQTYKELKSDLLIAGENQEENKSGAALECEIGNLPVPDLKTILFSGILDLVFTSVCAITFLTLFPLVKDKLYDLDSISKSFLRVTQSTTPSTLLMVFIATWFVLSFFFTILNHGSIGQTIMGLKICTSIGTVPSLSNLFKRFIAQIFNILTLGIRLLIQLKSKNGLSCKFSKTRLTYSAFVH